MDGQLAALRKEVGEREWAKVEEVLEGEFEEELWERVIGGLLEKLEAGGGEGGDDVGHLDYFVVINSGMADTQDEKPTWDDEDGDVGDGQVYEGADEAHADQEVGDDGPINMVRLDPAKLPPRTRKNAYLGRTPISLASSRARRSGRGIRRARTETERKNLHCKNRCRSKIERTKSSEPWRNTRRSTMKTW